MRRIRRGLSCTVLVTALGLWGVPAVAQTTSPPGIDLEVYNPEDGSNAVCVAPSETFWVHVFVRPGDQSISCDLPCGNGVSGGSGHIAAGVIDLQFDPALLEYQAAESNPDPGFAAVDGLLHTFNVDLGRIGWALAGDWVVDGDPDSSLKDPCVMQKLSTSGWVFRLQFTAMAEGSTSLHLRDGGDHPPFALSFADICGSGDFTLGSGGIDELVDATVVIDTACSGAIFADGFETGDTTAWSAVVP